MAASRDWIQDAPLLSIKARKKEEEEKTSAPSRIQSLQLSAFKIRYLGMLKMLLKSYFFQAENNACGRTNPSLAKASNWATNGIRRCRKQIISNLGDVLAVLNL